jgi:hypothetical protein
LRPRATAKRADRAVVCGGRGVGSRSAASPSTRAFLIVERGKLVVTADLAVEESTTRMHVWPERGNVSHGHLPETICFMNVPNRHVNAPRGHVNVLGRHVNVPRRHVNVLGRHVNVPRRHVNVPAEATNFLPPPDGAH